MNNALTRSCADCIIQTSFAGRRVAATAHVSSMDDTGRCCDRFPSDSADPKAMGTPPRIVLVWDAPLRVFHWLIVLLVAAAYATLRLNWMVLHGWVGYAVLNLLLFRLLWGFFGGETARFSHFLASPRITFQHLKHAFRQEPDRQLGHNPAGGWMVLLLLALLLAETLTGVYVANDIAEEGPLTEIVPAWAANAIEAAHAIVWDALLAAIVLHLLAIAGFAAIKGQNLLRPMITGTKVLPASIAAPRSVSTARASLLLLGCAVATALLVNLV
jgi:cytochrome b